MNALALPIERAPSRACPDCAAERLGVFGELTPSDGDECGLPCAALEAGADMPEGWRDRYAYAFVRRGVLIRERVDVGGARTAIDILGPGSVAPLGDDDPAASPTARAATRVLLCLRPKDAPTLPDEAHDLVRLQRDTIHRLERLADARGRRTAKSKVTALLCTLSDTLQPGRPGLPIPASLKQRDLAAVLHVRHETVCRVLRDLEKKGLIRRDADGIALLERERLEQLAGGLV